jgi:hypothetical protein
MEKNKPSRFLRNQPAGKRHRKAPGLQARRRVACGISLGAFSSREEAIEAMKCSLIDDWSSLAESDRRTLGFDPASKYSEEEEGLTHLAYILIDCANRTLDDAVAARRRRLLDV